MTERITDTVRELLEGVLEETDDSDVHFKIRTALQLLDAHDAEIDRLEVVDEDEEELASRLRELGYLD